LVGTQGIARACQRVTTEPGFRRSGTIGFDGDGNP